MFPKSWISNSALFVLCQTASICGYADDVQYFGNGIDYWHKSAPTPKPLLAVATSGGTTGTDSKEGSPPSGAFPWHQYLDPKNKEFFKEGDYTPPEPFMEIVRNPTDANLKMWFDYIGKKNELSSRLGARMQEYLAKTGPAIPVEENERVTTRIANLFKTTPLMKRYRFRLYFDSHCPHCKRMLGTMADLQTQGYFVEARQIDKDTSALSGITIPVEQVQPDELKGKDIQSVPVLLVGDLDKKVVYRINGYQSTAQVLIALPKEGDQQKPE